MVDNLINERIAKKIANSGLCSIREAERLMNNGCVKLNGNVYMMLSSMIDYHRMMKTF